MWKFMLTRFCSSATFYLIHNVLYASSRQSAAAPTTRPPIEYFNITVPQGTNNHGDPNLLCTPSTWTEVATFFLANFVAHAATVRSLPGESALSALWSLCFALAFPTSGTFRALSAIYQRAMLASTPVETALRAGALCMVVRTRGWRPQTGDRAQIIRNGASRASDNSVKAEIEFTFESNQASVANDGEVWEWIVVNLIPMGPERCPIHAFSSVPRLEVRSRPPKSDGPLVFKPSTSAFSTTSRKVHGVCQLPPGYALSIVPTTCSVYEFCEDQLDEATTKDAWYTRFTAGFSLFQKQGKAPLKTELSCNYSLPKALIAVFQALYASATLYRVRGDQIQRYGYAAFSLTVAPYLVMSIINFVSTMFTPDYPTVYLVKSSIMQEAQLRADAKFEHVVGTINSNDKPNKTYGNVMFEIGEDDRTMLYNLDEPSRGLAVEPQEVLLDDRISGSDSQIERPFLGISSSPDMTPWHYRDCTMKRGALAYASVFVSLIPVAINGISLISSLVEAHLPNESRPWRGWQSEYSSGPAPRYSKGAIL